MPAHPKRVAALILLLGGACSGGDGPPLDVADADPGLTEFTITNADDSGELHSVTIRCEDLAGDMALTLRTDGTHEHEFRLEIADMQAILDGLPVTVSFTEGHEHRFTIVKPANACLLF